MRLTIPDRLTHRCLRPGCGVLMRPLKHTVYAENGNAMVTTAWANQCGMSSIETWRR